MRAFTKQTSGILLSLIMILSVFAVPVAAQANLNLSGSDTTVTTDASFVEASFTLENTGDEAASGPAVEITNLPQGWSINSVNTDGGTAGSGGSQVLYLQVAAGSSVNPVWNLSLPNNVQAGTYEIQGNLVQSGSVTQSVNITVTVSANQANFQVTDFNAPSTGLTGETFNVDATIENTGNAEGTQTVEYRYNGSVVDSQEITLGAGENTTVTFSFTPDSAGNVSHGVSTDDDTFDSGDRTQANNIDINAEPGRITGRVTTTSNQDVANVTVRFDPDDPAKKIKNTTTNENGDYTSPPLSAGTYSVEVIAKNFDTIQPRTRQIDPGQTTTADLVVVRLNNSITVSPTADTALVGQENTFTVTVRDADGQLIDEPVRAIIEDVDSPITFVTSGTPRTNSDGQTFLEKETGSDGQVTFTVTSDEVVTNAQITFEAQTSDRPSVTATKSFIVEGEGTIEGQVFNSETTEGEPNANVYAVRESRFYADASTRTIDVSAIEADVSASDRDDTVFFRVLNTDGENEVVNNNNYRVTIAPASSNTDEQIGLISSLNTTNAAVGSGFAAEDRDGDGDVEIRIVPLQPGNYTLQASAAQRNNSRISEFSSSTTDDFENVTDLNRVETDNTREAIENLFANISTMPSDETDEDGDYLLKNLFTDGQAGQDYVLVAEKSGFTRDFADVTVTEDGVSFEGQGDDILTIREREITLEFRLDVQVENSNGVLNNQVRTTTPRAGQVTVEVKPASAPDSAFEPIQSEDAVVDEASITLNMSRGSGLAELAEFNGESGDTVTASVSESPVSFRFIPDENDDGTVFVNASTEDGIFTEDGARVDVFTTGEIKGDVLNDNDDPVNGATVKLRLQNAPGNYSTLRTKTLGPNNNAFSFVNVETGRTYRVVATDPDTGNSGFNQIDDLGAGTTNADIVVVNATAGSPSNGNETNGGEPSNGNETNGGEPSNGNETNSTGPAAQYAGDDGIVQASELNNAIDDWRSGNLSAADLNAVIDAWRSGEQVS